jgi:hypothetical protein
MRIATIALLWAATAWLTASSQEVTPIPPAEKARFENMISVIQEIQVSKLDPKLPRKMAFGEWLQGQGGPNVRMNWVVRYDATEHTIPDCVEADANMSDGKTIMVWVAFDHPKRRIPYVYRVDIVTGRDTATGHFKSEQLDRLRDIPTFLLKLKTNS